MKRFLVSYDLEAEYEIDGVPYRARNGMHLSNTRGECHAEVRARIGTVMHVDSRRWGAFPSAEVMAHFPGMVAARYSEATQAGPGPWLAEYDGPAPEVVEPFPGTLMWGPWARACADRSYELRPEHFAPQS